jgi:hypothetical protein
MQMDQSAFNFDGTEPAINPAAAATERTLEAGTLNAIVYGILTDGRWWMPWEISEIILRAHRTRVSDSSITARLRDLRKDKFGKHTIELRKRPGSCAYEYRLVK